MMRNTDRRKLYGKYNTGNLENTMSAVNGNDKFDRGGGETSEWVLEIVDHR